jgi:hypothetical protein
MEKTNWRERQGPNSNQWDIGGKKEVFQEMHENDNIHLHHHHQQMGKGYLTNNKMAIRGDKLNKSEEWAADGGSSSSRWQTIKAREMLPMMVGMV